MFMHIAEDPTLGNSKKTSLFNIKYNGLRIPLSVGFKMKLHVGCNYIITNTLDPIRILQSSELG